MSVKSYTSMFPYYHINSVAHISYEYFKNELTKYATADSVWRPCINGKIDPIDPLSGCIGTRIVGGLDVPLREFAYPEEAAAGKSASTIARECVLCMIASVRTRKYCHNADMIAGCGDTHTTQPFKIDAAEWPRNTVIYPSNIKGAPNGLCAPFPDYDARMLCTINSAVLFFFFFNFYLICYRGICAYAMIWAKRRRQSRFSKHCGIYWMYQTILFLIKSRISTTAVIKSVYFYCTTGPTRGNV